MIDLSATVLIVAVSKKHLGTKEKGAACRLYLCISAASFCHMFCWPGAWCHLTQEDVLNDHRFLRCQGLADQDHCWLHQERKIVAWKQIRCFVSCLSCEILWLALTFDLSRVTSFFCCALKGATIRKRQHNALWQHFPYLICHTTCVCWNEWKMLRDLPRESYCSRQKNTESLGGIKANWSC